MISQAISLCMVMAKATFLLLLLILFAFCSDSTQAQQKYSNISLGSSLTPHSNLSAWFSPSRVYSFGFINQDNGLAVGISLANNTVVWTAARDTNPVLPTNNITVLLTTDGRFIIQTDQGHGQDIYIANFSEPISSASMLDTGNFVLYNRNQTIIWQSFEHPTDTILQGQRLVARQELISRASANDYSKGIFGLYMQDDGNLVEYPIGGRAVVSAFFSTGTYTYGDQVTLNLDDDGHLYLLNSTINILNLTQGGLSQQKTLIYLMRLDLDGIFRVYSHSLDNGNLSTIWESSNDKCSSMGLCGLNGFCVLIDQKAKCQCLPGFYFINPDKLSPDCVRNYTTNSCNEVNDVALKYEMRRLNGIKWGTQYYSTLVKSTSEDCEKACLEDCNCEVAIFKDDQCRKHGIPMRYGRQANDSSVALIKVTIPASITNRVPEIGIPTSTTNKVSKEKTKKLIISISLAVFALLVLAISVIFDRRSLWLYNKLNHETGHVEFINDVAPRAFTYAELKRATNGFEEELGRGAFGTVYKGLLPNSKKVIAVKRLDKLLAEGEREFQTEMKVIGKTHHRNLVRLVGYCIDGLRRLLVYEFMSKGSLADVLFFPNPGNKLSWEKRLKITINIASGILYLHEECETQIIHCDIKPQNILMDHNNSAKIADFGLAKLVNHDQTRTYTKIRGTRGYVAPEWHLKMPITFKVDVYSFGIVLLEIICCRKNVNWTLPEEADLEEIVYDCFEGGDLAKLVADEDIDRNEVEKMVKVSIWCIQDDPSLRPSMDKVLLMLEGTIDVPVPPRPRSI